MKKLNTGWQTYDNDSVFSHVLMPYGYSVKLNFQNPTDGRILNSALVGRRKPEEEHLHPGSRSWDGAYTDIFMEWMGTETRVESADVDDELYIIVTPLKAEKPLTLHVDSKMIWKREGNVCINADSIEAKLIDGIECSVKFIGAVTTADKPTFILDKPMAIAVHNSKNCCAKTNFESVEEIREIIDAAKAKTAKESEKYGDLAEVYDAMRSVMAWDTIYIEETAKICTPVSRLWNLYWSGYVLFCWDTYFASLMSMFGSGELAAANAEAITDELTESGFVPNFGAAGDMKSRDRSQPPVGSMAVYEIYKKFGNVELIEKLYDRLLGWNKWYHENRMLENGTFCWGSDKFEGHNYEYYKGRHRANDWQAAAYESGLDNSPMFDDIPFDEERNIMLQADVGLSGLFIMDCAYLIKLAKIIGRDSDIPELEALRKKAQAGLDTLWNEELGIYCNYRIDINEFNTRLSPTNFYALYDESLPRERVERMISEHFMNDKEFMGEFIIPMISRDDPAYTDQFYWRGRIWAPCNFLVYEALKNFGLDESCKIMADKSVALLLKEWREHGHVHENYNGDNGEGCDVNSSDCFYHWGALLSYIALDYYGFNK